MRELYRILKKGGTLIAQVPLEEGRLKSFEDDSITDKKSVQKFLVNMTMSAFTVWIITNDWKGLDFKLKL